MTASYVLEYYGLSSSATDISSHVVAVDQATDSGTGEIAAARVMLDAKFGNFITRAVSGVGATPLISTDDLIRLRFIDPNGNTFGRYYIVDDIIPQRNDQGLHVVLEMFGREKFLQEMFFTGRYPFVSFADMLSMILVYYNNNKGSTQPTCTFEVADLAAIPRHTYGTFDFGDNTSCYDALMEVVTRLSLPVPAGGGGEYYALLFQDVQVGANNTLRMRVYPQGSRPSSPVVLTTPISTSTVKSPPPGNVVVVQGQPDTGTFPHHIATWRSLIEEYENIPGRLSGTTYMTGAYVRYNNNIYQARRNTTATPPTSGTNSSWREISFPDYVESETGDRNFQYSPWTKDKAGLWKNWGANSGANSGNSFLASDVPSGRDPYDALAITDSNMVIRDEFAWRDWVDFRVRRLEDIPRAALYPAGSSTAVSARVYFGMRLLIDPARGSIRPPFTGNDKFGTPYRNSLVQMDKDGDWIVFREGEQFDECVVIDEGMIYEYNLPITFGGATGSRPVRNVTKVTVGLGWRNTGKALYANDAFHYPSLFECAPGLVGAGDSKLLTFAYDSTHYALDSSICIEYRAVGNGLVESILNSLSNPLGTIIALVKQDGTLQDFTIAEENGLYDVEIYNTGWWATLWAAPFPFNTNHGITEDVGELFGGDVDGKVPLLDADNLNRTPSGKTGYGHDDSSELGQLSGFKFLFNFNIFGMNTDALKGDIPCRATIYDIQGNVWVSDTRVRFLGATQEMDFPFSSFHVYRARVQPGYAPSNVVSRILNPERHITDTFNQHQIKRINFQVMIAYDSEGRYDHITWENFLRNAQIAITGSQVQYKGFVDGFHFVNTPVAIARNETAQAARYKDAPIKKYPGVSNIRQLQKIATAELDIAQHSAEIWTAKYPGRCDIGAEDTVIVHDADFIPASETVNSIGHRRRLAVKKVTYSAGSHAIDSGFIASYELYKEVST